MRFSAARVFRMKLGGATWKEVAGSSNNDKRRGYFFQTLYSVQTGDMKRRPGNRIEGATAGADHRALYSIS